MFAHVYRQVRAGLNKGVRYLPVLGAALRARDSLQDENTLLLVRLREFDAAREEAERARWGAVAEREQAERARWAAISEREEAERACQAAIRQRDAAEHARNSAMTQRDDVERARAAAVVERDEAERARAAAVVAGEEMEQARAAALARRDEVDELLREALSRLEKLEGARGAVASRYEDALRRLERHRADAADGPTKAGPGPRKDAQLRRSPCVSEASPHAARNAGPKISVLLPNFNHGAFIGDAIEGVLAQTYKNWELVIVDDGSTDNSRDIIQSFAKRDGRVIAVFSPENRGVTFAINIGMATISGSLFYGSAADDYVLSDQFFEAAVAALDQHPEAAGVFGKTVIIEAHSRAELWTMGCAPLSGFIPPRLALEAFLVGSMFVPGSSAIWKRAAIDALGGFDDALGPQTDYFINHALPALSGAVFVDQVFTAVRTFERSYHRSADDEEFFARHALVEKKLRSLDLPGRIEAGWLRVWREGLINGRFAAGYQQAFYDAARSAVDRIEPWERRALPKTFSDHLARFEAERSGLENDLSAKIARAHEVFETVAGPLSPGKPTLSVPGSDRRS